MWADGSLETKKHLLHGGFCDLQNTIWNQLIPQIWNVYELILWGNSPDIVPQLYLFAPLK